MLVVHRGQPYEPNRNHIDQMSNCEQTRATLDARIQTLGNDAPVVVSFVEALDEYFSHIAG